MDCGLQFVWQVVLSRDRNFGPQRPAEASEHDMLADDAGDV
jgi:hypothetical protein